MSDTITGKPLAGGVDVAPADGGAAGSEEVSTIHEILSQALGKDFKDDTSALKAVKDTFSYVGKVGKFAPKLDVLTDKLGGESKLLETLDAMINNQPETPAAQSAAVDTSKFVTREEMQRDQFYQNNPDYKPYQAMIDALAKSEGKSPADVVASDSFKPFFEKAKAADDKEKEKSVLHSNARLGAVTDATQKMQEASARGDKAGTQQAAYDAIMGAYPELEKRG